VKDLREPLLSPESVDDWCDGRGRTSLALNSRDESVGPEFWEAMAMPALYTIDAA
jgi:hypothetical protein